MLPDTGFLLVRVRGVCLCSPALQRRPENVCAHSAQAHEFVPCACAGQVYPRALLHMLSRITRPWVTCWGLQGMHLALGKILNRALKSTRAAKCHQLLLISLKVNNLPGFGSGGLELRRRGRLLRRQKCPGRRSEMVELRSNSAKSSDLLLFILFTCVRVAEEWVGRLN